MPPVKRTALILHRLTTNRERPLLTRTGDGILTQDVWAIAVARAFLPVGFEGRPPWGYGVPRRSRPCLRKRGKCPCYLRKLPRGCECHFREKFTKQSWNVDDNKRLPFLESCQSWNVYEKR
jgi:hypothetical protein